MRPTFENQLQALQALVDKANQALIDADTRAQNERIDKAFDYAKEVQALVDKANAEFKQGVDPKSVMETTKAEFRSISEKHQREAGEILDND